MNSLIRKHINKNVICYYFKPQTIITGCLCSFLSQTVSVLAATLLQQWCRLVSQSISNITVQHVLLDRSADINTFRVYNTCAT